MTPLVRAYVCICVRACALVYVRRDVLTYVRMYACTTYRSTYECMHARQIKDLRTFFSFGQLFQRINPRALALSYVQMHTRTQDVKTYMHTLYMHTYTCMPEYTHTHTHTHTHTRALPVIDLHECPINPCIHTRASWISSSSRPKSAS